MSDGTIGKNNHIDQFRSGLKKSGFSEEALKKLEDKDLEGIFAQMDGHDGKLDGKINLDQNTLFEAIKTSFTGSDPKKAEEEFTSALESYSKEFKAGDAAKDKGSVSDKTSGETSADSALEERLKKLEDKIGGETPATGAWKKEKTREARLKALEANWNKNTPDKDADGKPFKSDPARKQANIEMNYNSLRQEDRNKYEAEGRDKGLDGAELQKYAINKMMTDKLGDEKETARLQKELESLEGGNLQASVDSAVSYLQNERALSAEEMEIAKNINSGKLSSTGWAADAQHPFKKMDSKTINKIQQAAARMKLGKDVAVKQDSQVQNQPAPAQNQPAPPAQNQSVPAQEQSVPPAQNQDAPAQNVSSADKAVPPTAVAGETAEVAQTSNAQSTNETNKTGDITAVLGETSNNQFNAKLTEKMTEKAQNANNYLVLLNYCNNLKGLKGLKEAELKEYGFNSKKEFNEKLDKAIEARKKAADLANIHEPTWFEQNILSPGLKLFGLASGLGNLSPGAAQALGIANSIGSTVIDPMISGKASNYEFNELTKAQELVNQYLNQQQ